MPAVIPAHIALRTRFREIIGETVMLNERLEHIIAVKSSVPSDGFHGLHGEISHSPAPWNSAAANSILDLHSWSRQAERDMRVHLNLPLRYRGGSSKNTYVALKNIGNLADGSEDDVVHDRKKWLNGWCTKASIVLGETETAKRLPRVHGSPEAVCPWCKRDTLRQLALDGIIKCIDPGCADEDGRRPFARLEYFKGDMVLRWQDGIIGAP